MPLTLVPNEPPANEWKTALLVLAAALPVLSLRGCEIVKATRDEVSFQFFMSEEHPPQIDSVIVEEKEIYKK